ncbi:MAG: magnesium transporter CorA family protein [Candidatus Hydrogenedentes bacterium]|nr:magnesium transporter CorA family protein [Candidatus Hydrogenedentota bacterium]
MLTKYAIDTGHLVETQGEEGNVLVFVNPDEEERRRLEIELKVDEHTLTSALDPDELSRLEFEPEHLALIFKRPKNYQGAEHFLFRVTSMGLFLFKNRLIVVASENDPLFDGKLFARVRSLPDVMLKLMARSIVHFLQHLKVINLISDELETKLSRSMENRYLLNLFSLEKSLVFYLNAIHTNGVVVGKLKYNVSKLALGQEESEFLDDIGIENDQCYKLAEIYSNVLSNLMDARASIVNNNLNVLMKTLNLIVIAIMVPTFVVSTFSMNVPMPFNIGHSLWSFWGIMGLATLSMVGLLYIWRRKRL